MKKLLLILLFIPIIGSAQILYPDTLTVGVVGQAYNQDLTFYLPLDTVSAGIFVEFTDFHITSISLPLGLTWECNNSFNACHYDPNVSQYAYVNISGTPLVAGNYDVDVNLVATHSLSALVGTDSISFSLPMTIINDTSSFNNTGFAMTNSSGCAPITVSFTNNNTGMLSYFWDFGNGNTSTMQDPVDQIYSQAGQYIVQYSAMQSNPSYFLENIEVVSGTCTDNFVQGDVDLLYDITTSIGIVQSVSPSNAITQAFPLMINLSNPLQLTGQDVTIEVWDDDGWIIGLEYCGGVTFTPPQQAGTFSANGGGLSINYTVMEIPANTVITVITTDTINVYGYPNTPVLVYDTSNNLISTSSDSTAMQWYYYNSPIPGATDTFVEPTASGLYSLVVVNENGCLTTSLELLVSALDTSTATLYGCTNPLATNYDPIATVDNGSCCGLQLDWAKIGQDIDGEASVDASGRAISFNSSGDILAVGARWNDGSGTDAGQVRVYQNIGNSWVQLGQDIDGELANDFSGHSLAINGEGDRVAIGAYGNDDNGANAGHVRVYEYNDSAWIQLGQDIDGELANDFKGFQVDINQIGDKIVVGSYGNDDNGINSGKTQVYYFDGNSWIQFGSNIYGTNPNDASGKSVQISGLSNIIAIGAPFNAYNGANSGQVRVFEFHNGDWVQMGQDINGESNGDFSGAAISLNNSGNIIAIGAKRNDGSGYNAGHVRVFKYAANSWVQIGQDIDGVSTGDESGYSLSLNGLGNKIAIGSYLNSDSLTESGHVRVFYFDITSWNQIGNDIYGEFPYDWSGRSVALNEIGDKLAIGADLNDGNGTQAGHVRLFSYNSSCLEGCTDLVATNYDSTAIIDDGSCFIYGCTGPTSCNYDPNATMDDGSCSGMSGCTDSAADNYNSIANCDDGSCTYTVCTTPSPTGAYVAELTHDRVRFNWDDMNSSTCMVEQYRIRYREAGTSVWSSKTMSGSGLCQFGLGTTSKMTLNLLSSTTYEYYMKAWYCGGSSSGWSALQNFTTEDDCQNVINFTVSTPTPTKATFAWDTVSAYSFVRLQLRVDTTGATWFTAGGFGVFYPDLTKSKNGLVSGESYRASARTWCNPNGGPYRSATWSTPIFWTQPTSVRIDGGAAIANLDVYPNPSTDVFNITFTSESIQDLRVRILNVVGEVIISEDLAQFVGEYTKQINLKENAKGVYFLEIVTDSGVINKKLMLQ